MLDHSILRLKQSYMKLESFIEDMHAICEDEELTEDERYEYYKMREIALAMEVRLFNGIQQALGSDDFIN